jgi:hypothetical protein
VPEVWRAKVDELTIQNEQVVAGKLLIFFISFVFCFLILSFSFTSALMANDRDEKNC